MTIVESPRVHDAVERSADPLVARACLRRLVEAHPWLADELGTDQLLLDALVAVSVASHSLFALLERDPAAVKMLASAVLRVPMADSDYAARPPCSSTMTTRRAALRRWKHRQLVRIAGRDLLGIADLRSVGAELAAAGPGVPRRRARDRRAAAPWP